MGRVGAVNDSRTFVIGHEFVGEVAEVGSNVADLQARRHCERRRSRRLRAMPQLPGRTPASLRAHDGRGRQSAWRIRRVHRAAHEQHLAAQRKGRPRNSGYLRSLRKRGAYGTVVPCFGGRRTHHRGRANRNHGRCRGASRRRSSRGDHRYQREAPQTGGEAGSHAGSQYE